MSHPVTIVALAGSLSARSTTTAAVRVVLEAAAEAGAAVELLELASLDLPMYNPDAPTANAGVERLVATVAASDGLVLASPLYHGTVSGAFKNALDWLELLSEAEPSYLTDKVVGLVATAGGVQGVQAINTMGYAVRALRGWAVPLSVPVSRAWQAFDEAGRPTDPAVARQLAALGREIVRMARVIRAAPTAREAG